MHVEFDNTGRLIFHTKDNTELKALKAYSEELMLAPSNFLILNPEHCDNTFNQNENEQ